MKRIKAFLKKIWDKYKVIIICFFVPIIIFLIACAIGGIFPFGQKVIAAYDGIAQYPGFTSYFSKVLRGQESFFYSFKGGLGYNFYATFVYYLSNPTNLLSIFANENNFITYYLFIILLRIGLSGITMSMLLKYKNKNGKFQIIFSIAYALMAYNVLYFYNYMYFDSIVLFPLVVLGLNKLVHESSPKMYFITLSLSIFANFYIGYMICIFSLLYFIYLYILLEKKNKRIIYKFITFSILSALINSFILIPVIMEILSGKITMFTETNTFTNYWAFTSDYINFIYKMTVGSYKIGQMSSTYPNIYCSILCFVLAIFYFFNKKISKKEKILSLIFISIYILCFSFNLLDYAWHMFQRPVWYPKRYSFTFSLFIILLAYKSFNNITDLKISEKKKWIIFGVLILLIILSAYINNVFTETGRVVFLGLSLICIVEYFLTIGQKRFTLFICMIFFIEITGNTVFSLKNISYSRTYDAFNISFKNLNDGIEAIKDLEEENTFYRTEMVGGLISNDPSLFNYNGIEYFNSLRNQRTMNLLTKLDQRVIDGCSTSYSPDNLLYNSILGVKYLNGNNQDNLYTFVKEKGFKIYRNDYALSLGFMTSNSILKTKLSVNETTNNMNNIMNDMLGNDTFIEYVKTLNYTKIENMIITPGVNRDRFDRISNENGTKIIFNITPKEDGVIVFTPYTRNIGVNLMINNEEIDSYSSKSNFSLLIRKGNTYVITLILNTSSGYLEDYMPMSISLNDYKKFINEMKLNELNITYYKKDNYIKGTINVEEERNVLYTSIPYDTGWSVYVDGKKINYTKVFDALIALELKKGTHTIEFKFIPRGLIIGACISFVSFITSLLLLKKEKTRN